MNANRINFIPSDITQVILDYKHNAELYDRIMRVNREIETQLERGECPYVNQLPTPVTIRHRTQMENREFDKDCETYMYFPKQPRLRVFSMTTWCLRCGDPSDYPYPDYIWQLPHMHEDLCPPKCSC